MTFCDLCPFEPKTTDPSRIDRAVKLHKLRKHGISEDGVVRECPHGGRHKHGTNQAYTTDGCRCARCRKAAREHKAHRGRMLAYGRWDRAHVPAGPVAAHIADLRAKGTTIVRIAKLSGVPLGTVKTVIHGRGADGPCKTLRLDIAKKILAVKPDGYHDRYVPSVGTTRRLQALVAIGYSGEELARSLGGRWTVQDHLYGKKPMVERATEKRVRDLYEILWDQPNRPLDPAMTVGATRARNLAKRNGWVPPMAWDDDSIDDPAAVPDMGEPTPREDLITAQLEDLDWLAKFGVNALEAADRLGKNPISLRNAAQKHGRPDLARKMAYATRGTL